MIWPCRLAPSHLKTIGPMRYTPTILLVLCLAACGSEEKNTDTQLLPTATDGLEVVLVNTPSPNPAQQITTTPSLTPSPSFSPTQTNTPAPTLTPSITFSPTFSGTVDLITPTLPPNDDGESGIIIVDSANITLSPTPIPASPTLTTLLMPSPSPVEGEVSALPTLPPQIISGRLLLDQPVGGDIAQAGEIDRYTFFANFADPISVVVNQDAVNGGTLNPYLQLQGPTGEIILENDDLTTGILDAMIRQTTPSTGVYTLYVKSADELGIGSYTITLGNDPLTLRDVDRGPSLPSTIYEQALENYGQRDSWTVELNEGDIISVAADSLDATGQLDLLLELVAPDGTAIAFDNNSGGSLNALLDSIVITVGGTYTFHIAALDNATIGPYRLFWLRLSDYSTAIPVTATPSPVPPSGSVAGSVEFGGNFSYPLPAEAGQDINLVVTGQNGFDPVLRLFDPIGNIIIEVDDVSGSQDPRARLTALTSGQYRIEVVGFEGSAGQFTLNYIVQ